MDKFQTLGIVVGVFGILNGVAVLLINAEDMRQRREVRRMAGVMSVAVELVTFLSGEWAKDAKKGGKK